MGDLYEILGVSQRATDKEIKNGYQRKVMQSHPDRGGSADLFAKVKYAYDVLSDPAKRKEYDETGEVKDIPITVDEVKLELIKIFRMLITSEKNLSTADVVGIGVSMMQSSIDGIQKEIYQQGENLKKFKLAENRMTVNGSSENIFNDLLLVQIDGVTKLIEQMEVAVEFQTKVMADLKNYEYSFDVVSSPNYNELLNKQIFSEYVSMY